MIYPAILIFLAISMVIFMLVFILPKITESFTKTGVALPGLTQVMINVSGFLTNHYVIILLVIAALIIGFNLLKRFYL